MVPKPDIRIQRGPCPLPRLIEQFRTSLRPYLSQNSALRASTESVLGDMIATTFTSPMFTWIASPLHTEMEVSLCDYLCSKLSLPNGFRYREGGAGVIVGTRNEALIPVLYTAKHRK